MADAVQTGSGKGKARARQRLIRLESDSRRLDIVPPEGVPLRFEIASLGTRLAAQILDMLITFLGVIAILLFFAVIGVNNREFYTILGSLLFFFLRTPYYAAAELLWNGRTLGKKMLKIRVISATGRSLTAYQIAVRNLLREMEIFLPGMFLFGVSGENISPWERLIMLIWIIVVIIIPNRNKRSQRLGDIIANTVVVSQPVAALKEDLTLEQRSETIEPYVFTPGQLDHYGAYETQVLAQLLQGSPNMDAAAQHAYKLRLQKVMDQIIIKTGYEDRVPPEEGSAFLNAFYRAQRDYLERKKLFGDAREDKFHHEEVGKDTPQP